MKKISCIILFLALMLLGTGALAANTDGLGSHVTRSAELAAFMDDSGNIFVSGLNTSINATPAENLIAIDPYRILFLAKADQTLSVPHSRLISIDLESHAETIITDDAKAACLDLDNIYYVSAQNPAVLYSWNADSGKAVRLLDAAEAIERVYPSANGVIVSLVEDAGAYIQDAVSGAFVPYGGDIAAEIASGDGFEAYLTGERDLYIAEEGQTTAALIDTGVQAWCILENRIYYLTGSAEKLTLKCYDAQNAIWSVVLQEQSGFEMQLTASGKRLFMLSSDHTVYTVENDALKRFASLPELDSYNLGGGKTLSGYQLEAVSGQLNIYGKVSASDVLPTFTFVDFTTQVAVDESSALVLLSAYSIDGEQTVWNLLQPAPQYSAEPLRRGSRGEAVSAIQQPLKELGYYDYHIDGIFGWRTERAVKLLQMDLNLSITGAANADLQRVIIEGNLAPYDPYKALIRGDRGLRVQDMQERLRDLGFLADDADAIFGARTQAAVERFQSEHNLEESGIADANTLKKLYAPSAKHCESYIDLQKGDTGYRVRELNSRLKELYYLEGDVGSSYNSATVEAVKRFQAETGLKQTGAAGSSLQQKLFSRKAPEYSGHITLRRGDENSRVKQLQKRLKALGYYADAVDGYFGSNTQAAIKLFQRVVGIKATGIADPYTLALIYADDAPAYKAPEKITAPIIELSAYSKYENGVYFVADSVTSSGSITASWFADGDVDGYDLLISDDRGNVYIDQKGLTVDNCMIGIPVTSLDADRVFTIKVTAYPRDYADDKPASASLRFVRLKSEPEPQPEEIGQIGKLIITPVGENISRVDGVYQMPGDILSFSWNASGSVEGYVYEVTDANADFIAGSLALENVQELNLKASKLKADTTYELQVWAIPTNGNMEHAVTGSIFFQLKKADPVPTEEPTPVPTEEPTPEPTEEPTPEPTEEPTSEPTEEPTPVPTEEPTPEPTEEPTPEPTEEPTPEPTEEPTPEPTEEPTPVPTEDPTPEPTEEPTPVPTEEPTPEPTEEPTPEPTEEPTPEVCPTDNPAAWQQPIDVNSDPAAIATIQNRLAEWLWLEEETFTPGVLDEASINAVIAFQNHCIGSGLNLTPWSEELPAIGTDTLWLLFNADGMAILNPNV